ncbi:TetR/AcrR family transcriptional regulator [Amycolatopsis anabasis]|uniref:TetR/AcrR family transcriptional regulator n=1 Tax=Amycolatopsis anabasis TaxID=1840409 RepID=UPI00131CA8F7|nr:TetR family transcriptional regulator C-terminal domain-containing protein [Amycolatopsis anabasis]
MSKLVERPSSGRGQRRREQLIEAGVELLAEGGWPAVTTRAVAERGAANTGLIHYHFGGLPGLHAAIARKAGDAVAAPAVESLLAAADSAAALEALRRGVREATADEKVQRLAVELLAGAMRDPELGGALRDGLREAREQIAAWLARLHPRWSPDRRAGMATLVAALIDGLTMHLMLDDELGVDAALDALEQAIGGAA